MKIKRLTLILSVSLLLLSLNGCIGVNRQFSEVKNNIMGAVGNNYKTEFQFSVGSSAITISSWFIDLAADEEYIDEMMREISSVQVGVYNIVEGSAAGSNFATLQAIDEEMNNKGWNYIVRSADGNELTAIYLSDDPGELLNKMYVINLNDEELIIIEVNGDLKKVISYAIEEKEFNIRI
jgi:hypothetical protein